MKKIYLPLVCLFFATSIFSQKETNNWIFGFGNQIDFNQDPPAPGFVTNINFFSERNTVSMSDESGNLLFTTDGFSVFDKDLNQMPNGFISANFSVSHPTFEPVEDCSEAKHRRQETIALQLPTLFGPPPNQGHQRD